MRRIALSAWERTSAQRAIRAWTDNQMTSGQVWPVGRWSEVMLDQLLRSLSG
jgi:hypothetical protein